MSDWSPTSPLRDADLEAADRLLDQANALLRRHCADALREEPAPGEGDDLPILTDMVDESDPSLPLLVNVTPAPPAAAQHAPPAAPAPAAAAVDVSDVLTEQLVRLDTELRREIEHWVDTEFPQILGRELDRLTERMQTEMLAHLRAILLPELSNRISRLLDQAQDPAGHDVERR